MLAQSRRAVVAREGYKMAQTEPSPGRKSDALCRSTLSGREVAGLMVKKIASASVLGAEERSELART